jgi:hypothetical protein
LSSFDNKIFQGKSGDNLAELKSPTTTKLNLIGKIAGACD